MNAPLPFASPKRIDVWFVLPAGSLILDWAGPAEAFRFANTETASGAPFFKLRFAAPAPNSESSVGAVLSGLEPLPDALADPAWVIVVGKIGPEEVRESEPEDVAVIQWLKRLRPGLSTGRLITICSGALLAASAGLLAHRKVTTHHADLELLRQIEPRAQVAEDRVFVRDGEVWSSAGVTAGIDLALYLISDHCGPVVAARVAQRMAVALRRGPDDPQLSPFLAHRQHLNARLHRVQDAISQAPTKDWDADEMAKIAYATPRTLHRLFALHTQTTPSGYLRSIRLGLAKAALGQGCSVGKAAELAGFSSDLHLRRAWIAAGEAGLPSGQARRH